MNSTALVRDLCAAVADMGGPASAAERCATALRLTALAAVLLGGAWLYWWLPLGWVAIAALLIAGGAYALLLIASHEMAHGTCLGLGRWEQPLGCLLSWPMAWPFLTYSRLHRLHHRWNGRDRRDPERTTALPEEKERAGMLRRLWQRQQLPLRLLLERVIGLIVQFRGLVEHHGLWQPRGSHLLTQLSSTRNVNAASWLNALMGGLPHHSAHHAFPWIPSARLPLASRRIAAVLQRHGSEALPQAASYGQALGWLWRAGHFSPPPPAGPNRA